MMLAEFLGVPRRECHIGMFDAATCLKVIDFSARKIGVFLDE